MKCGKVKNPCKICFQSVSNKNGLQCKGACKKWAHFQCLNYTPGKICDIKAGYIKVTCPCPDCSTEPKEIIMKPPLNCKNEDCPATKPLICEVPDCPKKQNPIPSFSPAVSTPPRPESPNQMQLKCPPEPKVPKCPTPARKFSSPEAPSSDSPRQIASSPCPSPPGQAMSPRSPAAQERPPSPPSPAARPKCPSCPKHCPNISPQRSQSCSLEAPASFHSGKSRTGLPRSCSSDSALLNSQDQKMLYCAVEQMCDTVGQLSSQLKDFMCKLMNAFQKDKQT